MISMSKFKIGDYITILAPHRSLGAGGVLMITSLGGDGFQGTARVIETVPPGDGGAPYLPGNTVNFNVSSVSLLDRKMQATRLKEEGERMVREGQAMLAKSERLSRYDSDEEELAATMVEILESEGTKGERIAKIASILKGRDTSSML